MSPSERHEVAEIEKSLKVSSYMDNILDNITTGSSNTSNVPDYSQESNTGLPINEAQGVHMTDLFEVVSGGIPLESLTPPALSGMTKKSNSETPSKPKLRISQSQHKAIQKYPSLVEFLGSTYADKIAQKLITEVNVIIAKQIGENSQEIHEHAITCDADRHNLKQYFKGPDWICRVTASGPFTGNEAIYYSTEHDSAFVLHKDNTKYSDVTHRFNVIHEHSIVENNTSEENIVTAEETVSEAVSDDSDVEIIDD